MSIRRFFSLILTVRTDVFTKFEIEITLAAAPSTLIYRADPARHLFTVHFQPGGATPEQHHTLRYDEITPDLIRENCRAFLQAAFPS